MPEKKNKRFQVDIFPDKREQLEKLRKDCQKAGVYAPSLPMLVDRALSFEIDRLRKEFLPK